MCCSSWGRKESDMTEQLNWLNRGVASGAEWSTDQEHMCHLGESKSNPPENEVFLWIVFGESYKENFGSIWSTWKPGNVYNLLQCNHRWWGENCIWHTIKTSRNMKKTWHLISAIWLTYIILNMSLGSCFFFFFFFLVVPHNLWDLSSLTRDQTWTMAVKALNSNHCIEREFLLLSLYTVHGNFPL